MKTRKKKKEKIVERAIFELKVFSSYLVLLTVLLIVVVFGGLYIFNFIRLGDKNYFNFWEYDGMKWLEFVCAVIFIVFFFWRATKSDQH